MAFADFIPTDRPVQVPLADGFRAVVRWIAARRIARARKAVLRGLLFAPEHRLRDLGISRYELLRAIEGRRK
jgi:uncharacterized protein YjiS (DUF1127 family)